MVSDDVGKAMALLRAVSSGDAGQATRDVDPDVFVQHDPFLADGVPGLLEHARRSAGSALEVVRVLQDPPYVVAHGRSGAGDHAEVFFVVFRFENGLVVEQWRFASPVASPNESGHTQTDGPTEPDDAQDPVATKALVRSYYETVHVGGRHDRIGFYMSGDRQIRHEPGVRDGVAAFARDLTVLTRSRTIDEIVHVIGQGDFVFIAARGTHEGDPCAYVDLYRVEAGRLVEHWGFPQTAPRPEQRKNDNNML